MDAHGDGAHGHGTATADDPHGAHAHDAHAAASHDAGGHGGPAHEDEPDMRISLAWVGGVRDYFKAIFDGIWSTLVGMRITLAHFLTYKDMTYQGVTVQYPTERWKVAEGYRGMLFNDIDDCIVCNQCANDCPADCILIEGEKAAKGEDLGKTSGGTAKKIKALRFDIDLNHCLFCGLCTEVCPTECLIMTDAYEYAAYSRDGLYMQFARPEMYKKVAPAAPAPAAPTPPPAA